MIVAIKQKLKGGKKLRFGKVDLSKAQLLATLQLLLYCHNYLGPPKAEVHPTLAPRVGALHNSKVTPRFRQLGFAILASVQWWRV